MIMPAGFANIDKVSNSNHNNFSWTILYKEGGGGGKGK